MSGLPIRGNATRPVVPVEFVDRSDGRSLRAAPVDAHRARRMQRMHARRVELLGRRLSAEIAWNMLLDLVIAEEDGRAVSITALAIGACAPLSTALRYVELLSAGGYVVRLVDETDRRRSHVRLTARGRQVTGEILVA